MNPLDLLLWMAVGAAGAVIVVSIPMAAWIAWKIRSGKL